MNSAPKWIVIEGVSFCRDDTTGYYLNSALRVRAHRFVYERAKGPIPPGYHVHHKNEDKSDNHIDNLELMRAGEHATHHGTKRATSPNWLAWSRDNLKQNAVPLAAEWHQSEEGLAWHREHAKRSILAAPERDFNCEHCGETFQAKPFGAVKFCSNACRSAHRRAHGADNIPTACTSCGTIYARNKYKKSQTCSPSCRNRFRALSKAS